MSEEEKIACLVDSAAGIYIPKEFIAGYADGFTGIGKESRETLLQGPDAEGYWEAWESVMDSAEYIDLDGHKWQLYEDGDLFMVRDDWGGFD